jgi:hypothetical protein
VSAIEVFPMGPHEFSVTVGEGDVRTTHRVEVPDDIRDALADVEALADEPRIVREAVEVLLERKVVTELPHDFSLGWAADEVPDLVDQVRTRVS